MEYNVLYPISFRRIQGEYNNSGGDKFYELWIHATLAPSFDFWLLRSQIFSHRVCVALSRWGRRSIGWKWITSGFHQLWGAPHYYFFSHFCSVTRENTWRDVIQATYGKDDFIPWSELRNLNHFVKSICIHICTYIYTTVHKIN